MQDLFQKPNPFSKDIAVVIDEVVDLKIGTLSAHELQMFEWLPWTRGVQQSEIPKGEEGNCLGRRIALQRMEILMKK